MTLATLTDSIGAGEVASPHLYPLKRRKQSSLDRLNNVFRRRFSFRQTSISLSSQNHCTLSNCGLFMHDFALLKKYFIKWSPKSSFWQSGSPVLRLRGSLYISRRNREISFWKKGKKRGKLDDVYSEIKTVNKTSICISIACSIWLIRKKKVALGLSAVKK